MPAFSLHLKRFRSLLSGSLTTKMLFLLFPPLLIVLLWGSVSFYQQYLVYLPEGTEIWGESLAGMNRVDAERKLEEMIQAWQKKELRLQVQKGDEEEGFVFSLAEIPLSYDLSETVDQFLNPVVFSADALHAAGLEQSLVYRWDEEGFDRLLKRVVSTEEEAQNAKVFYDEQEKNWLLEEHRLGYGLTEERQKMFQQDLLALVERGDEHPELALSFEVIEPEITTEELTLVYEQVQELQRKEIHWSVDGFEVVFSLKDYPQMIEVTEHSASVSQRALADYVKDWAKMFDREAGEIFVQEAQLQERDYLKSAFSGSFEKGRSLNQEAFLGQLLGALEGSEERVEIQLEFEEQSPRVKLWDGEELTLLSEGRSSYKQGNGADRVYNVKFGLQKYDGVVIPQGAEFSFNQVLGWVTYDAGWKPALAIFGGGGVKPVPGGGLCQVSTTVFRAAIKNGLPITQRKPHSLDVSYYHEYGYGIDATIYPPEDIDLKFVNDTPGPIVIHTFVDEVNEEAFVEFYGVDDGRKVELVQVENRQVILPKQVIESADLPAGVQEIQHPGRIGRYIEWAWKIVRADGTVEERSVETLYPGAAKVVLVGGS